MRDISSSTFVSLDGVVNHMDKWHFDFVDDESDALALEQLRAADAMLMGRKTYEVYAATWLGREGEYAALINAIPKYVASTTLTGVAWENTTILDGDLIEAASELRNQGGGPILMHGYGHPGTRVEVALRNQVVEGVSDGVPGQPQRRRQLTAGRHAGACGQPSVGDRLPHLVVDLLRQALRRVE